MRNVAIAAILASATIVAQQDRQPVVAVGGAYGLMSVVPAVPSGDCPDDCGCGGTGKVGDGRIEMDCGCPPTCSCKVGCMPTEDTPLLVEETSPVVRMSGPRWTFENRGTNPPDSVKREHLREAHGLDGAGLSSEELSALHDNAHNYGDIKAFGLPSMELSEGCPGGNCPSPSSGRSTVRRGLFGRWR